MQSQKDQATPTQSWKTTCNTEISNVLFAAVYSNLRLFKANNLHQELSLFLLGQILNKGTGSAEMSRCHDLHQQ